MTAFILLSITLSGIFFLPNAYFMVFISLLMALASWEWAALSGLQSKTQKIAYLLFIYLIIAVLMGLFMPVQGYQQYAGLLYAIFLLATLFWCLATIIIIFFPGSRLGKTWLKAFYGILVLVPAWLALSYLHALPQGAYQVLLLMMVIWLADTGAYFTGKRWGKRKLAPQVSPGKSWEGVAGAFLFVSVLVLILYIVNGISQQQMGLLIMVVVVSVVGDLWESLLKRRAGLKDSGHILPGHGGILDRIDSLTAAAPVFAFGLMSMQGIA